MRMKKSIIILSGVALVVCFTACSGGKYDDAKKVVAKSNSVLESFLGKMDQAGSAAEVAAAMTGFTDEMEKIAPEMKKLEEKYPDLAKSQSIPPELGEEGKKMMELWGKFASVMMKIAQYSDDPEVQKAQEKLESIMK